MNTTEKSEKAKKTEQALIENLTRVHNRQKAVLRALKRINEMDESELPEDITKLDLLIELQEQLESGKVIL